MIRRIIATAGIAVLVLASPAAAQYGTDPVIEVTDPTVVAGGPLTVNGTCFEPGSTVTLAVDGEALATGIAAADTTVTVTATLPADLADGSHTVTLTGPDCVDGSTHVLSASIVSGDVDPQVTSTTVGTSLPVTGSDSTTPMVAAGAVLVGGGALLVLAGRKRSQAEAEA